MAISKDDQEPLFYYQRGNVYLNKGNFIEAHNDYDRALDLDEKNPKFWLSKGLAFEG